MFRKIALSVLVIGLVAGMGFQIGLAADSDEIQAAIDKGIAWLESQQNDVDGSWGSWAQVAKTGFAVVKLADYAYELALKEGEIDGPFDEGYIYHAQFLAGLDYLESRAVACGPGICFDGHETYETGIAMMAIAATKAPTHLVSAGPYTGATYQELLQGAVDYFAWSQKAIGGWCYESGAGDWTDNSNSGYAVLGLRYAEAFGCAIPPGLKDKLNAYIDYIQNDPGPGDDEWSDDPDGGSGYSDPRDWVNVLKTGNLLFEMAFVSDDATALRALNALDYIERHWNDPNWDPGWKGPGWSGDNPDYQAMYCLMKGFESMAIDTIVVGASEVDWFDKFTTAIVNTQHEDGYWPQCAWGDELLSTEWALLVLEKVTPPLVVEIDIKPGSFPNSINPGNNGTIPVAIFSTEQFNAPEEVDPLSLAFGPGEAPINRVGGKKKKPHCSAEDVNGDGLLDLVCHFETQTAGFQPGDEEGILTGLTYDGSNFSGSDSVRIVPPNKPSAALVEELPVVVFPNPISDVHTAYFRVAGPLAAEVTALRVRIFDLAGKLVWDQEIADNELAWHTDNLAGEYLANGVYLYRVQAKVAGVWISTDIGTIAILR